MSIKPGTTITKDPDARKVYTFDWSAWLVGGAEIDTSSFIISGPDAALTKDSESDDGTTATLRLIGGTAGATYTVTNRVVTDETPAQTEDNSIKVRIAAQ